MFEQISSYGHLLVCKGYKPIRHGSGEPSRHPSVVSFQPRWCKLWELWTVLFLNLILISRIKVRFKWSFVENTFRELTASMCEQVNSFMIGRRHNLSVGKYIISGWSIKMCVMTKYWKCCCKQLNGILHEILLIKRFQQTFKKLKHHKQEVM